jgi:hypothetical protein
MDARAPGNALKMSHRGLRPSRSAASRPVDVSEDSGKAQDFKSLIF